MAAQGDVENQKNATGLFHNPPGDEWSQCDTAEKTCVESTKDDASSLRVGTVTGIRKDHCHCCGERTAESIKYEAHQYPPNREHIGIHCGHDEDSFADQSTHNTDRNDL